MTETPQLSQEQRIAYILSEVGKALQTYEEHGMILSPRLFANLLFRVYRAAELTEVEKVHIPHEAYKGVDYTNFAENVISYALLFDFDEEYAHAVHAAAMNVLNPTSIMFDR